MQGPIERVMQTYGLMMNLSEAEEEAVRVRLTVYLKGKVGSDEELAVQGLRFLRGRQDRSAAA